jgi:hypothetical protein
LIEDRRRTIAYASTQALQFKCSIKLSTNVLKGDQGVRIKIIVICTAILMCCALDVRAQEATAAETGEQRVSLEEQATALDSNGRGVLAGRLLTKALAGTADAPVKNARFIIENRSSFFYTYVSGNVTFYDEQGVRCGEGQFALNALAPSEAAETDAPSLRLSCSPRTWRIVANNLLMRVGSDVPQVMPPTEPMLPPASVNPPATLPLEIVVDDKVYNAPLGSTLEIPVRRRLVKITVRAAQ